MRVSLFIPCFVDLLAPEVGMACARVLESLGHEVRYSPSQTCCGQPALNAGHHDHAASLARRQLTVLFEDDPDAVVAPSGSCVAALTKASPRHLGVTHEHLDRVWELSAFLTDRLGITDVGARWSGTVTWHDACHPLRELGIAEGPRRLLAAVEGLELREMTPSAECCGFGGTFSVKHPRISTAMGERKIAAIEATGADAVASTETSCLLQIGGLLRRRRSPVRTVHLAEILASVA